MKEYLRDITVRRLSGKIMRTGDAAGHVKASLFVWCT